MRPFHRWTALLIALLLLASATSLRGTATAGIPMPKSYSTVAGTADQEQGTDIAVSANGIVYVAGTDVGAGNHAMAIRLDPRTGVKTIKKFGRDNYGITASTIALGNDAVYIAGTACDSELVPAG